MWSTSGNEAGCWESSELMQCFIRARVQQFEVVSLQAEYYNNPSLPHASTILTTCSFNSIFGSCSLEAPPALSIPLKSQVTPPETKLHPSSATAFIRVSSMRFDFPSSTPRINRMGFRPMILFRADTAGFDVIHFIVLLDKAKKIHTNCSRYNDCIQCHGGPVLLDQWYAICPFQPWR